MQKREKIRHFLGEINDHKQIYLIRNCSFEPSECGITDIVNKCLKDVSNAFLWGKPAIISSHRFNFVGFVNEKNRNTNLKLLDQLVKKMLQKWPDIEFLTSDSLGELIMDYQNS